MYINKLVFCVVFWGLVYNVAALNYVMTSLEASDRVHTDTDVSVFASDFAKKILGIINTQNATQETIIAGLRPVVLDNFDIDSIAKFSMGVYYRNLTTTEKEKFKKSFVNMLLRFYFHALIKYKNAKFKIAQVKASDKRYIVCAFLILDGKKYKLDCSIFMINNKWKILDVSMESVAMGPIIKAAIQGKIKDVKKTNPSNAVLSSFLEKFDKEYGNEKALDDKETHQVLVKSKQTGSNKKS